MGGSPYASSIGRLKSDFPTFLGKEMFLQLRRAKGIDEILTLLESTAYGPHLNAARATVQGVALLEIALNRALVHRNHMAWTATPFAGRNGVQEYLRRWDLRNIELILTAKIDARPLTEIEAHLVSARGLPAGILGGTLTIDDLRLLLEQPTVEAIAQSLVKFGYGPTLMPLVEQFAAAGTSSPSTSRSNRSTTGAARTRRASSRGTSGSSASSSRARSTPATPCCSSRART